MSLIKKTLYYIASISTLYSVDGHFRDTFSTSSIQPSLTFLLAQFMYFILFRSFKHDPSPCDIFREIKRVWFGRYGSISFGPFEWVYPIWAAKWARDATRKLDSWRRYCTWNFHPKGFLILLLSMTQVCCHALFSTQKT